MCRHFFPRKIFNPTCCHGVAALVPRQIPANKLFFRIGEVAEIVGVSAHVIRFWEQEFELLRPKKTSTGQRVFRRRDIETVISIRQLLYVEKYTISGARKRLQELRDEEAGIIKGVPAAVSVEEPKGPRLSLVPVVQAKVPQENARLSTECVVSDAILQHLHDELVSFLGFLDEDELYD